MACIGMTSMLAADGERRCVSQKGHFCSLIGQRPEYRPAAIFEKSTESNMLIGPKFKIKPNFNK